MRDTHNNNLLTTKNEVIRKVEIQESDWIQCNYNIIEKGMFHSTNNCSVFNLPEE